MLARLNPEDREVEYGRRLCFGEVLVLVVLDVWRGRFWWFGGGGFGGGRCRMNADADLSSKFSSALLLYRRD